MRKENDLEPVATIISATTMDIFDHYRESYSVSDIDNIRESIMRFGYMLNGLDFGLFKTKAILGEYKNRVQIIDGREFKVSFFKLTPDVYLDWFQEYIYQRGEAFANNSHTIHKSTVKESSEVSTEAAEKLKEIADKLKPHEKGELEIKPMEESKEQKQAKELQKWIENEFEQLWKDQGETEFARGGKYIIYKQCSRMLSDYIEVRFNEIRKRLIDEYNKQVMASGLPLDSEDLLPFSQYYYEQIEKLINGKV